MISVSEDLMRMIKEVKDDVLCKPHAAATVLYTCRSLRALKIPMEQGGSPLFNTYFVRQCP
jgi:hypothetical protein